MFEDRQQRKREDAMGEAAAETTTDPWIMAAGASVLLSWYNYFIKGNKEMGLFVGLWPPTFLAFASYFNQTRMKDMMNYATSGGMTDSRGIRDSIDEMMGRR